jgi:hypothetical protein
MCFVPLGLVAGTQAVMAGAEGTLGAATVGAVALAAAVMVAVVVVVAAEMTNCQPRPKLHP